MINATVKVYTHIYLVVCFSGLQNFVPLKTSAFYLLDIYRYTVDFFQITFSVQKNFFSCRLRNHLLF